MLSNFHNKSYYENLFKYKSDYKCSTECFINMAIVAGPTPGYWSNILNLFVYIISINITYKSIASFFEASGILLIPTSIITTPFSL
jgi:hypothetical protein